MRATRELYPEFGHFEIWTATHISVSFFVLFLLLPDLILFHPFGRKHPKHINVLVGKYGHTYIYLYISATKCQKYSYRESGLVYIFVTITVSETTSELTEKCQHSPEHVSGHHLGMFEGIFVFYDFHFSTTVAVSIIFTGSSSFVVPLCFFVLLMYGLRLYTSKQNKIVWGFLFL